MEIVASMFVVSNTFFFEHIFSFSHILAQITCGELLLLNLLCYTVLLLFYPCLLH